MKKLVVSKSNELVRSPSRLTLIEHRFLATCIGQIFKDDVISVETTFEINLEEFAEIFGIEKDTAYREFKKIALSLREKSIEVKEFGNSNFTVITSWVNAVKYDDSGQRLIVRFAEEIIPHISQLKGNFIRYNVGDIAQLTSPYAIKLFELLKSYNHKGERFQLNITIEELKSILGVEDGKYSLFGGFNRMLLGCLKEIEAYNGLRCRIIPQKVGKAGKKVGSLVFKIGEGWGDEELRK